MFTCPKCGREAGWEIRKCAFHDRDNCPYLYTEERVFSYPQAVVGLTIVGVLLLLQVSYFHLIKAVPWWEIRYQLLQLIGLSVLVLLGVLCLLSASVIRFTRRLVIYARDGSQRLEVWRWLGSEWRVQVGERAGEPLDNFRFSMSFNFPLELIATPWNRDLCKPGEDRELEAVNKKWREQRACDAVEAALMQLVEMKLLRLYLVRKYYSARHSAAETGSWSELAVVPVDRKTDDRRKYGSIADRLANRASQLWEEYSKKSLAVALPIDLLITETYRSMQKCVVDSVLADVDQTRSRHTLEPQRGDHWASLEIEHGRWLELRRGVRSVLEVEGLSIHEVVRRGVVEGVNRSLPFRNCSVQTRPRLAPTTQILLAVGLIASVVMGGFLFPLSGASNLRQYVMQLQCDDKLTRDSAWAQVGRHSESLPADEANLLWLESFGAVTNRVEHPQKDLGNATFDALTRVDMGRLKSFYRRHQAQLRFAFRHPNPAFRMNAARIVPILQREGLPWVGELITLLDDPQGQVRAAAAEALGLLGSDSSLVVSHLTSLVTDTELQVRRAALEALGSFGSAAASAAPALEVLLKDHNYSQKQELLRTLRRIGTPAAVRVDSIHPDL